MVVYFMMAMVGFYTIRYFWVRIQCERAIQVAAELSKDHIYKCADAFGVIEQSILLPEQKYHLKAMVRKCLNRSQEYFEEGYYKDFDYNKLWLDPYKWSLKQMFPTLMNMKPLEVSYE